MKRLPPLIALLLPSLQALADSDAQPRQLETMVITATRTETPLREVGSAITVITAQDIANRQVNTVADALRTVPGLDVVRAGGLGQVTSVFLRGAASTQTLVLIDGIEMQDPASPGNAFDFANLTTDNIERIEVLRGPQSSLYGSDAIGGVINIITKKGAGKPRFFLSGQGGTFDSFKVEGGVHGGTDLIHYSLTGSRLETAGFSAADERLGNKERDGYKNTTVSARAGITPSDSLDFDWTLRFNDAEVDIDDGGGRGFDDPNSFMETEQLFTRGQGQLKLFDGLWEQTLSLAYSLTDRTNVDKPDPISPFGGSSTSQSAFEGHKVKASWQNKFNLHPTNTLIAGITDEEEWIETDDIARKSANIAGYYLQDQIKLWNRWFTALGIRFDDHNRVGGKVTGRVTQSFFIHETGTQLKGSYGTGFKAPSLFQLFAPATSFGPIGNPDLKPEKSRSWDAGFEQTLWKERVLIGTSYFHNTFEDLIDFIDGFVNINQATSEGVEAFFQLNPLEGLTFHGNYTYTRTADNITGKRLLRRPTHKGSFNAHYRFLEKADINLNILVVGERADMDFSTFPAERLTLPGYVIVNLAGSYDMNKHVKLFARVDNLFDKEYQEVFGFGTSSLAGYAGVRLEY